MASNSSIDVMQSSVFEWGGVFIEIVHNPICHPTIENLDKTAFITYKSVEDVLGWKANVARVRLGAKNTFCMAEKHGVCLEEKKAVCIDSKGRRNIMGILSFNEFQLLLAIEYSRTLRADILNMLGDDWKAKALEIAKDLRENRSIGANSLEIPRKYREKFIQEKYNEKLCGIMEVVTPHGTADIVTCDSVYEVKTYKEWKHALGQVLVYSKHLGLKPFIILFDCPCDVDMSIRDVCCDLGVSVIFVG